MVWGCCCEDKSEKSQVDFDPNNERNSYGHGYGDMTGTSPDFGNGVEVQQAPAQAPPPSSPLPPAAAQSSRATGSTTSSRDREKAEEKARLQELVKVFAKRATKGIDCQVACADTGSVEPATYFLEKDLKELTVKAEGKLSMTCKISQIQDIHRLEEDESILPTPLNGVLSDDDKKRLLLVQYSQRQLCLLESSIEDAETFFTAMRVLRLYSQQQDIRNGR
mmetsp:Transcript_146832/g.256187  ORF Transcript_146832/g.256187 Transcript_146832/m.256187 type:complete len:221 (-) Transcript_146832:151-813(-)